MTEPEASNRREFLTGRALRDQLEQAAAQAGEALSHELRPAPGSGPTVRLVTRAMATEFSVVLNTGPNSAVETWFASDALDLIQRLEDQMTVYRADSELIRINRQAAEQPVVVESRLFELLKFIRQIALETNRACDPTSQRLVSLWRQCRQETRIPSEAELQAARTGTGIEHVHLDEAAGTIQFDRAGIELNLNCVGKGWAVDRAAELLLENKVTSFVLQGGHSSVIARGEHNGLPGWPIGITNPLFPDQRLGTLLLKDRAMGTSGSGVQFFRVQGRRFGHILDPRTGWPVDHLLSVTVLAPTSALADALSTAFFVMGPDQAAEWCRTHPEVQAILIPPPAQGRALEPILLGLSAEELFLSPTHDQ